MRTLEKRKLKGIVRRVISLLDTWKLFKSIIIEAKIECGLQIRKDKKTQNL